MSTTSHTKKSKRLSASDGQAPLAHLPVIDGLRGIAILLVIWYHAPFIFLTVHGLPEPGFWRMSTAGWIGVDLFFVVSGFLITSILLRTRGQTGQLRIFWARRSLRILPLAYLYLLVIVVQPMIGNPWGILETFDGWVWYFSYFANVHIAQNGFQPVVIMILWSLAVEEQFYFVWPIVVHLLDPARLLKICLWICVLTPLLRAVTVQYPAAYVLTFCRADTLAMGAILSLLVHHRSLCEVTLRCCRKLTIPALLILAITLLAPFGPSFSTTHPYYFTVFGYSLIAASFAVLVGASMTAEGLVQKALCHPILLYIGKRCYGCYLWHCAVGLVIANVGSGFIPKWLGFEGVVVFWIVCVVIVASISWTCFEKPILSLKRFVPHPDQPVATITNKKIAPMYS